MDIKWQIKEFYLIENLFGCMIVIIPEASMLLPFVRKIERGNKRCQASDLRSAPKKREWNVREIGLSRFSTFFYPLIHVAYIDQSMT